MYYPEVDDSGELHKEDILEKWWSEKSLPDKLVVTVIDTTFFEEGETFTFYKQ